MRKRKKCNVHKQRKTKANKKDSSILDFENVSIVYVQYRYNSKYNVLTDKKVTNLNCRCTCASLWPIYSRNRQGARSLRSILRHNYNKHKTYKSTKESIYKHNNKSIHINIYHYNELKLHKHELWNRRSERLTLHIRLQQLSIHVLLQILNE